MLRKLSHSQNFLRNSKLVSDLLDKSDINANDTVYEIGPGKGIITEQLIARCVKVFAIEYDRGLFENLKKKFFGEEKTKIIFGNFLKINLPRTGGYKVFSNIPFNLTADILTKLLFAPNPPSDSYLIVQEEAARKYTGRPYGEERFRSLVIKPKFELTITHRFERTDFYPVPAVDIVLLRIRKRDRFLFDNSEQAQFNDFVAYVFSHSGKNLKERTKKLFSREQWGRLARDLRFEPLVLPGELNFDQWLGLFRYFAQGVSADKQAIVRGSYAWLLSQQKRLDKIHRLNE